jgi:Xaa-Pro aminopeptidase
VSSMTAHDGVLKPEFLQKKMQLVLNTMREMEIDAWLVFSREGNEDPVAADLGLGGLGARYAGILQVNGNRTAVVGSIEEETLRQRGFYQDIYGYGKEGVGPKLSEIMGNLRPKTIAVNVSEDYGLADGLSSGMKGYLIRALKDYGDRLISAEDLVITLRAQLLPEEIEYMKHSITECEDILREVERDFIRVGRKDREIHEHMKSLVYGSGLEAAWAEELCPSITVGTNPPGHVAYHNDVLEDGDFLRIDFGVRFEGYCSDVQRVYWIGKGEIPAEVKKMFDTARQANDAALRVLRSEVEGYIPDQASRNLILASGYPDFPHGTGHALGRAAHEIGPALGPRWPERYGRAAEKKLRPQMAFTIEPSVYGPYGVCNIEQDVLVTEDAWVPLSTSQDGII